jgi:hypothetical protein
MDSVIYPYDVFRIDKPNASAPEFGAYQLPTGEVRVLTNNFGQSEITFGSKEQADIFLAGLPGKLGGQVVELNPQDYPRTLTSSVSFDDQNVHAPVPQQRAEQTKPADTQSQDSKNVERDAVRPEDRAVTKDANNNLPETVQKNAVDDYSNPDNARRADETTPEVAGQGGSLQAAVEKADSEIFGPADNGKRTDLAPDDKVLSFLEGAGAGVLQFLAEATEATPYLLMTVDPFAGLILKPLYSWAAEGIRDEASEEMYEASLVNPIGAEAGAGVGYFGATIINAIVGPKGSQAPELVANAAQRALPAAEREMATIFRVEGKLNTRLVADGQGGIRIVEREAEKEEVLWLSFEEKSAVAVLGQRLAEGERSAVIKAFEVPRQLVNTIRSNAVPEGSAFAAGNPLRRLVGEGTAEFGVQGTWLQRLQGHIAGRRP